MSHSYASFYQQQHVRKHTWAVHMRLINLDSRIDLADKHDTCVEADGASEAEEAIADDEHVTKVHDHGDRLGDVQLCIEVERRVQEKGGRGRAGKTRVIRLKLQSEREKCPCCTIAPSVALGSIHEHGVCHLHRGCRVDWAYDVVGEESVTVCTKYVIRLKLLSEREECPCCTIAPSVALGIFRTRNMYEIIATDVGLLFLEVLRVQLRPLDNPQSAAILIQPPCNPRIAESTRKRGAGSLQSYKSLQSERERAVVGEELLAGRYVGLSKRRSRELAGVPP